jgi:hypothetical protein
VRVTDPERQGQPRAVAGVREDGGIVHAELARGIVDVQDPTCDEVGAQDAVDAPSFAGGEILQRERDADRAFPQVPATQIDSGSASIAPATVPSPAPSAVIAAPSGTPSDSASAIETTDALAPVSRMNDVVRPPTFTGRKMWPRCSSKAIA